MLCMSHFLCPVYIAAGRISCMFGKILHWVGALYKIYILFHRCDCEYTTSYSGFVWISDVVYVSLSMSGIYCSWQNILHVWQNTSLGLSII